VLLRKSASIKWRSEGLVASSGRAWVNELIDSQSMDNWISCIFTLCKGGKMYYHEVHIFSKSVPHTSLALMLIYYKYKPSYTKTSLCIRPENISSCISLSTQHTEKCFKLNPSHNFRDEICGLTQYLQCSFYAFHTQLHKNWGITVHVSHTLVLLSPIGVTRGMVQLHRQEKTHSKNCNYYDFSFRIPGSTVTYAFLQQLLKWKLRHLRAILDVVNRKNPKPLQRISHQAHSPWYVTLLAELP
jgi:hypothetical protein